MRALGSLLTAVNQQFITSAFLKDPTDPDARDGDFSRGNVMKQAIAEYAASKVFLRITPPLCVHVDISSGHAHKPAVR
jgi:hypothetical protein